MRTAYIFNPLVLLLLSAAPLLHHCCYCYTSPCGIPFATLPSLYPYFFSQRQLTLRRRFRRRLLSYFASWPAAAPTNSHGKEKGNDSINFDQKERVDLLIENYELN